MLYMFPAHVVSLSLDLSIWSHASDEDPNLTDNEDNEKSDGGSLQDLEVSDGSPPLQDQGVRTKAPMMRKSSNPNRLLMNARVHNRRSTKMSARPVTAQLTINAAKTRSATTNIMKTPSGT